MKQTDSILTEHFYLGRKNGKNTQAVRLVLKVDITRDTVYYRCIGGSLHGKEKTESIKGFRDWAHHEIPRPAEADLPAKAKSKYNPYQGNYTVTKDRPTPENLECYKNEFRALLGRYVV